MRKLFNAMFKVARILAIIVKFSEQQKAAQNQSQRVKRNQKRKG